ncbi:discoidin domain-containing protein [Alkalihalobacillus sp. 1P02AB]|uniref:discoidin domain-containing protein n=1 Tax=Alkalihalobacillus sp. 1P02AB TaxID=3132260 RepID=UPI0039A763AE
MFTKIFDIQVSDDGENFTKIESVELPASKEMQVIEIRDIETRYVRIHVTSAHSVCV